MGVLEAILCGYESTTRWVGSVLVGCLRGCRDGSSVKRAYCSSRELEFGAYHLHLAAHKHLEPQLQEIQCPLVVSAGPAFMCTHTHTKI